MSEPSGTAARLVARAGRRAIGRRPFPGLVEIAPPPSEAQAGPSPETAPTATPGVRPTPLVAATSMSTAASGALGAQAPRAADARTSTPLPAAGLAPISPEPHPTELPAGRESRPLVPPLAPVQPPGPSAPRRHSVSPLPAGPGAAALSIAASRGAVEALAVAPMPLVPTVTPPAPAAAAPRPATPPPVVIDRIEIVTPPARPPAPDPLASVAARRAGHSRHSGGR
jgi:hypothetical protein